jgi:hypothetical protein
MIREAAAALGTAELQILQWHTAATAIDDRLQIGGRLMKARLAPHQQTQPSVVGQHGARGREAISYNPCPRPTPHGNSAIRFALAISCGGRTPSMITGTSAGSSRGLRFGRAAQS